MKVAAYIRVSSDQQHEENQFPEVEALAKHHGWVIDRVYAEKKSAVKHRPEFEQMLKDARDRKFKVLLIWALDRFGRSMRGNVATYETLEHLGIRVVSVKEAWLDQPGPVRPLLVSILSWVAEQERVRIGERTRAGMARASKVGTKSGLPIGRPRRNDAGLDRAVAAVAEGMAVRAAAKAHNVPLTTLQRRLKPTRKGVASDPT